MKAIPQGICQLFRRVLYDKVLLKGVFWWALLSFCLFILAAVLRAQVTNAPDQSAKGSSATGTSGEEAHAQGSLPPGYLLKPVPQYRMFVAFTAGLLIGMWLSGLWKRGHPRALEVLWTEYTWRDCVGAGLLALIFTILGVSAYLLVDERGKLTVIAHWLKIALKDPGGLFALITGAGTLIGTYIAVQSILELKHTITSFSQLLDRLTVLINAAKKRGDSVFLFAFTPLPGAWNVGSGLSAKLAAALRDPKVHVRVVCLNETDHEGFLRLFEGLRTVEKGVIDNSRIVRFSDECETLLKQLAGHSFATDDTTSRHKHDCKAEPIRLEDHQMPGYYFFVTAERAIVTIPVGMPRLNNPMPEPGKPISVETLGFETTDRKIIQLLQSEFERYASWYLLESDLVQIASLIDKLVQHSEVTAAFIWSQWNPAGKKPHDICSELISYVSGKSNDKIMRKELAKALNEILHNDKVEFPEFAGVTWRERTKQLFALPAGEKDWVRLKRQVLEDAFPIEIRKKQYTSSPPS